MLFKTTKECHINRGATRWVPSGLDHYKSSRFSQKPIFAKICPTFAVHQIHRSNPPTNASHALCSQRCPGLASEASGEPSPPAETLHLHHTHCGGREREKHCQLHVIRDFISTEEMEVEQATERREREGKVAGRGARRGSWRGGRSVDPAWLKKLRLKLQQKNTAIPHSESLPCTARYTHRGWCSWSSKQGFT